jgi:hypothetical protein
MDGIHGEHDVNLRAVACWQLGINAIFHFIALKGHH